MTRLLIPAFTEEGLLYRFFAVFVAFIFVSFIKASLRIRVILVQGRIAVPPNFGKVSTDSL